MTVLLIEMHMKNEQKIAFETIYNQYAGRVYGYSMQLTKGDTYLSEEIVQTVFMKLWEKWDELHNSDSVLSYLFTTAKNTFLNYCEHETVEFLYADYVLTHSSEADDQSEAKQDAHFLEQYLQGIVNHMPPRRRRVFVMSRYQHMTNSQIAQQLGISEKTVEVHITLALKELKEKLQD